MTHFKNSAFKILSPNRLNRTREELDGLRGIAIIIVFLGHILLFEPQFGPGIGSFGQVGVYLFFVLSAYLLTSITVNEFKRYTAISVLKSFFIRRVFRIFPMYYLSLFLLLFSSTFKNMMFGGRDFNWINHFFLKYPEGNYWAISVELEFYFLIPVISFLILKSKSKAARFVLLTAFILLSLFSSKMLTQFFTFAPNFPHLPPYLSIFFFGILVAHLEYSFKNFLSQISNVFWNLTLLFGLILFIFLIPSIGVGFLSAEGVYSKYYFLIGGFASALVLISALNGSGSIVKLLKFTPLRYIGIISFSIYLLHVFVMSYFAGRFYVSFGIYLCVLFISVLVMLLATFTYLCIERPFINRAIRITKSIVREV